MTSLNKQKIQNLKISMKEYNQYAENLKNILGVTIPPQQEVTRDFVSNSVLAEALQYTPEQFTAEKREEANIAKISSSFVWEQAKQNAKRKEVPKIESTPIIKPKEKTHTSPIIEEQKTHKATTESKKISKTQSILHTPTHIEIEVPEITIRETTKEKVNEKSYTNEEPEKIEHADLQILEENLKALTSSISKSYEERLNALSIVEDLIKKHISKKSYNIFKTEYNNSKNHSLSLQKISVDIIKTWNKTVFHKTIAEVKANMNK